MSVSTSAARKFDLSKINGFAAEDRRNCRDAIPNMSKAYVIFASELDPTVEGEEPDPRGVLRDMFVGPEATDETKKEAVEAIKEYEAETYGLAQTMISVGQMDDALIKASETGEYLLVAGARRFLALCAANYMAPELVEPKISAKIVAADEQQTDLVSVITNTQRVGLNAVEQGRLYAKYHAAPLKWSDKKIAEHFGVYDQKGKLNSQLVRQRRLLMHPKVTDKDRQDIVDGTASIVKVLKKTEKKASGDIDTAKSETRERCMPAKALSACLEETDRLELLLAEHGVRTLIQALTLGMKVALQRVELPSVKEEPAEDVTEEAVEESAEVAA